MGPRSGAGPAFGKRTASHLRFAPALRGSGGGDRPCGADGPRNHNPGHYRSANRSATTVLARCFFSSPSRTPIRAEGAVSVEGESGFEFDIAGIKGKLSSEELDQLVAEFLRIDYFSLNDHYRDAHDGCPVTGTDCSSVGIVTSFTFNGRSKGIVQHTSACRDRDGLSYPRELTNLEKQIKEVVALKRR